MNTANCLSGGGVLVHSQATFGKNWSGEQPIPFSFPAVAKIVI